MNTVPIYWRGAPDWRLPDCHEGNVITAWIDAERWACLAFEDGYWREIDGFARSHTQIMAWIPMPSRPTRASPHDPLPVTLAALHHSREALDRAIAAVEKLTEGRKDWQ